MSDIEYSTGNIYSDLGFDGEVAKTFKALSDKAISGEQELLAEIAELRKDADRLDWFQLQGCAYGFEDMHEGNEWVIDGPFTNLRDAIDAAMQQTDKEVKG